jgi:hypothetical protein
MGSYGVALCRFGLHSHFFGHGWVNAASVTHRDANNPFLLLSGQLRERLEISSVNCAHVLVHNLAINRKHSQDFLEHIVALKKSALTVMPWIFLLNNCTVCPDLLTF